MRLFNPLGTYMCRVEIVAVGQHWLVSPTMVVNEEPEVVVRLVSNRAELRV
jgi:hypothetical protein